jgi:hypothetical protein
VKKFEWIATLSALQSSLDYSRSTKKYSFTTSGTVLTHTQILAITVEFLRWGQIITFKYVLHCGIKQYGVRSLHSSMCYIVASISTTIGTCHGKTIQPGLLLGLSTFSHSVVSHMSKARHTKYFVCDTTIRARLGTNDIIKIVTKK